MFYEVDISRIDLNLLALFEVVMQERHVGHAATRLSLSPSAVSHGLARLRLLLNDPLFLKILSGIQPTAQAMLLAPAIEEILTRVRAVVAKSVPFNPKTSERRFSVGAIYGADMLLAPALLTNVNVAAPGVHIDLYTTDCGTVLADIDSGRLDVAVVPALSRPDRFHAEALYEEPAMVVTRTGHPYHLAPSAERFCTCQHVDITGDGNAYTTLDETLAANGMVRRVQLSVSSFGIALAMVARTDMLATVPLSEAVRCAPSLHLEMQPMPVPVDPWRFEAIVLRQALQDAALTWFLGELVTAAAEVRAKCAQAKMFNSCDTQLELAGLTV